LERWSGEGRAGEHFALDELGQGDSMTSIWLSTERLDLRPYGPADLDVLERIFGDPGVRRYLFDDQVMPRGWVAAEAAANERLFAEHGYGVGLLYVRDEAPAEVAGAIGFAGFRPFFTPPELQLLYGLLPEAWGRGYATEVARALVQVGFEQIGLDEVLGVTDPPNRASMRVMERAGLRFFEQRRRDGKDAVYYRVRRPKP
jgi:RimJ/RimL family protein N-acetyltransferase